MEINIYLIQHYKGDQLIDNYRIIAPHPVYALIIATRLHFKAYGFLIFPKDLTPGPNSYHITHLKHFKALRKDSAKILNQIHA